MKKTMIQKLLLILLPILAVGLATTGDSVTAFDTQSGLAVQFSYFDLADVGMLNMAPPTAAILSLVSGILAAVYLGAGKKGCLKAAWVTAFLAACFAVLPVMLPSPVKVIPNPLLPILMIAEAILAYLMGKKAADAEKNAPRLGVHP